MAKHEPFIYNNAEVVRVIDGDTVRLKVDVGFRMVYDDNFRLEGIDTPERGQEGFDIAKDRMVEWLHNECGKVRVEVTKRDKYGRYLATISSITSGEVVNEVMINEGLAKDYYGGKR